MPLGTTAQSVRNLPTEPYVIDDNLWRSSAKKNENQITTWGTAPGVSHPFALPQAGVVAQLLVQFDGTLTIAAGGATTGDRWPYGLLSAFSLAVNGQQDLFGGFGEDFRVVEDIAYPAYNEQVDTFAGTVGGGNALSAASTQVSLAWLIPIATEIVTLTGALYAQSPSTQIQCAVTEALATQLFSANAGNATWTGNWTVQEIFFIPAYDSQGRIIVPSGISYLHSISAVDLPLTAVGATPNRIPLIRGSGNLQRLFMTFRSSPTARLSPAPNAAAANQLTELWLSYGATQIPYTWNPVTALLRKNNRDYGFPPPYDYLVLDTLKWDPQRDAIVFAGLTELAIFAELNSAVTLAGGTAHMVEETVFQ